MEMLDPETSTQRPLNVLLLLSYPLSLSVASVWRCLTVAIAGVWIWWFRSHQAARAKEGAASTAASHLLPPETTPASLLQSPQTTLPFSPNPEDEEEEGDVDEIEPACTGTQNFPVPAPVLALQEAARKKAAVYFEGHGGRRRGSSSSSDREARKQGRDEQDRVVKKPLSSPRWWDVAGATGCSAGCKVIRCWEDDACVRKQEEGEALAVVADVTTHRMSDLGSHRFQDWGVIDGNVVRLWEANKHALLRRPSPSPSNRG